MACSQVGRSGGTDYFYVNPLQRRTQRAPAAPEDGHRQPWYPCACCPPNLMRTLSSWPQYLATTDERGVQIHQYAAADLSVDVPGGLAHLRIDTDYPWTGHVTVVGPRDAGRAMDALASASQAWSTSATLRDGSGDDQPRTERSHWFEMTRAWHAGDSVDLQLEMPGRVTEPDARVDAVRGCVALERGPLVYCLETVDLPPGVTLEAIRLVDPIEPAPRASGRARRRGRRPDGRG